MIKRSLLTIFALLIPALVFGAAISTLTDNFNDNSIDAAKWTTYTEGGSVLEQNNEIEISSDTNGGVNVLRSVNAYDLTGSGTTIKIVDAGNQALASYGFLFLLADDTTLNNNQIYWFIGAGDIEAWESTGWNGRYGVTYVSATHKYLKIREASGTIYWDYSADGLSWTNFYSVANPSSVTSKYVAIYITSTAELSTTTAKVEDFNILPSATRRIIFIQ